MMFSYPGIGFSRQAIVNPFLPTTHNYGLTTDAYRSFLLADLTRFARVLMIRRPDPSRFLKATPEVADCTIYAERVMPARLARRSIISIWFSRAVTLTRTVLVLLKSVVTRNATAFSRLGSPAKSSILEGLGIFSPSSSIPAI